MSEATCFIVTYIEVAPAAAGQTTALLKQREELSRKSDGNARVEVFRRTAPVNQFALVSIPTARAARRRRSS